MASRLRRTHRAEAASVAAVTERRQAQLPSLFCGRRRGGRDPRRQRPRPVPAAEPGSGLSAQGPLKAQSRPKRTLTKLETKRKSCALRPVVLSGPEGRLPFRPCRRSHSRYGTCLFPPPFLLPLRPPEHQQRVWLPGRCSVLRTQVECDSRHALRSSNAALTRRAGCGLGVHRLRESERNRCGGG